MARTTWEDARSRCQGVSGIKGDIATIADQETSEFIKNNLYLEGDTWFGGIKLDGVWSWADGTPWNYTNWQSTQPDDDDATYLQQDYKWYDYEKTYSSHFYICQYSFTL